MSSVRTKSSDNAHVANHIQNLNCILEVLVLKLDGSNDEERDASQQLLKILITELLGYFCVLTETEHKLHISEYILQVLFSCLRRVCESTSSVDVADNVKLSRKTKKMVNAGFVEPELLVRHTLSCLARTTSPQTRNEALLFISALVDVYPSSVLKSLKKILNLISDGSMQVDDEYSFHVTCP
jgi:hypothetical protein